MADEEGRAPEPEPRSQAVVDGTSVDGRRPTVPSATPLLDELEKGPWPSFVTEMKRAADKEGDRRRDLLRQLERSYEDKIGHWKHGGIVGVKGYGGGVIGRYSDLPEEFPAVAEFHTLRVNQPSGWFYTTEKLRQLCDVWDKHGSGLTNMHGATGDIILLGAPTAELQPCFDDLAEIGFDLGGSGSDMRTPSCCVGPGRCEYACIDTLELLHDITLDFQDRAPPADVPLQIQDQDLRLPQRLRGGRAPLRHRHHRHLARHDPDRPGRSGRTTPMTAWISRAKWSTCAPRSA